MIWERVGCMSVELGDCEHVPSRWSNGETMRLFTRSPESEVDIGRCSLLNKRSFLKVDLPSSM